MEVDRAVSVGAAEVAGVKTWGGGDRAGSDAAELVTAGEVRGVEPRAPGSAESFFSRCFHRVFVELSWMDIK